MTKVGSHKAMERKISGAGIKFVSDRKETVKSKFARGLFIDSNRRIARRPPARVVYRSEVSCSLSGVEVAASPRL